METRPFSPLEIEVYNSHERTSLKKLSNDSIRAFSPITFVKECYPSYVYDEAELVRYVDTMHEMSYPKKHFNEYPFSSAEAALITAHCGKVMQLTQRIFGRAIRPWMTPLVSTKLVRVVQALAAMYNKPQLTIFELGCGSGHLGSLLMQLGHSYWGMDNCQAFYLWQNRLFGSIAGDEFFDAAKEEMFPYQQSARVVHMPWWHFTQLHKQKQLPQIDVMICDTALGEFHGRGLQYTCSIAERLLADSPVGVFFYISAGGPLESTEETIAGNFDRVGFRQVVKGEVTIFSDKNRAFAPEILGLAHHLPYYNPTNDPNGLLGRDIIPLREGEMPVGYDFYEFLDLPSPRSKNPF